VLSKVDFRGQKAEASRCCHHEKITACPVGHIEQRYKLGRQQVLQNGLIFKRASRFCRSVLELMRRLYNKLYLGTAPIQVQGIFYFIVRQIVIKFFSAKP
jgi:hypothetical protein